MTKTNSNTTSMFNISGSLYLIIILLLYLVSLSSKYQRSWYSFLYMQSIDIAFPTNILYLLLYKQILSKRPTTLNWEFGDSNNLSSGEETPVA